MRIKTILLAGLASCAMLPAAGWELALIGNNLTNQINTGNCTNGNFANGQIPGGQLTGSNAVGPTGTDELLCFADRGRELWARVTVRFR